MSAEKPGPARRAGSPDRASPQAEPEAAKYANIRALGVPGASEAPPSPHARSGPAERGLARWRGRDSSGPSAAAPGALCLSRPGSLADHWPPSRDLGAAPLCFSRGFWPGGPRVPGPARPQERSPRELGPRRRRDPGECAQRWLFQSQGWRPDSHLTTFNVP